MPTGVIDEVPNDQVVLREAHLDDDGKFVLHTLADLVRDHGIALYDPLVRKTPQIVSRRFSRRGNIGREQRHLELDVHVAFFRDLEGIVEGFGKVRKEFLHLLAALEIIVRTVHTHPHFVVDIVSGADTDQNVLHLVVGLVHVMHVVGRDEFNTEFMPHLYEVYDNLLFLGDLVILHLEVKVVAKDAFEPKGEFLCAFHIVLADCARNDARNTGGQTDQTFGMRLDRLEIDPRMGIEAVHPRNAVQFAKVVVTGQVLGKQDQVIGLRGALLDFEIVGHIKLTTDDGLYLQVFKTLIIFLGGEDVVGRNLHALRLLFFDEFLFDNVFKVRLRRVVKVHRTVHIAVIGDRNGVHIQGARLLKDATDPRRTIQKTVFRMQM